MTTHTLPSAAGQPAADEPRVEVSFVMPCLNESETLEACIVEAAKCIAANDLDAEIVIADNGSTDDSAEIARRAGARVVSVPRPGYGSALMGGFDAARGRYLIMGDADMSYDFSEAMPMIERMRDGADMVMGSRFKGTIEPGAMPFLHRWLGNPVLTGLGRLFFRAKISDFHCGLRGITKEAYQGLNLHTTGMEFASEMVVKASAHGLDIAEVPVTLRPDGRSGRPHLRTWRDGWRHLRFMLVLSPRWTLFVPGLLMFLVGFVGLVALGFGSIRIGSATLDVHTMVVAAMLVIVGYQAMTIAMAMRIFALTEDLGLPAPGLQKAFRWLTLERGIIAGLILAVVGLGFIGSEALSWAGDSFPALDPTSSLRPVIVGATLAVVGVQTVLMSFAYSMLGIERRRAG